MERIGRNKLAEILDCAPSTVYRRTMKPGAIMDAYDARTRSYRTKVLREAGIIGQPEDTRLTEPEMEQIAQRIASRVLAMIGHHLT